MELYQDTHPKNVSSATSPDGPRWPPVEGAPEQLTTEARCAESTGWASVMANPHIIIGESNRCLCGMYGITELGGERPTNCGDLLAAMERLVQTHNPDARLLAEAIGPLVTDCALPNTAVRHAADND